MKNIFELLTRPPKKTPVGRFRTEIVSLPEECDAEEFLPLEIRFIFKNSPDYRERVKQILANGKAIGVRTMLRTPENILRSVHTISVHSQRNYIVTWLPALLKDKHLPRFTESDRLRAKEHGEDLDAAVETIMRDRLRFKRIVLIDEENRGISHEEQRFITELSEIIYPLAVDYSVFRVIADNARERTEVAQTIVKTLFVVGPVAHILEKFVGGGAGKVFAASIDDLLGESAEIMALRGSGFTWKELAKRGRILIPVFALATWGALSVHGLLEEGRTLLGGAVFGLSAVALSLTTAIQSIFMYRANAVKLSIEEKIKSSSKSLTRIALRQDFTNPARLGLFIGAICAPIAGMTGALLDVMDNGWVLAAIGSTESIIAGLTVFFADRINEWRFRKNLERRTRIGTN